MNWLRVLRRGMSIIEVLVASALMLSLSLVALVFLINTLKEGSSSRDQLEVQQDALIAMRTIVSRLRMSDVRSVNIGMGNEAIAYLDAVQGDGSVLFDVPTPGQQVYGPNYGQIMWQAYNVLYFDGTTDAIRLNVVTFPTPQAEPSPFRMPTFVPTSGDRVIAFHIVGLSFTAAASGVNPTMPTQNPINVALIAAMSPSATYQVSLSDVVVMQNNATTISSDLVNPTPFAATPFQVESTSPTGTPTSFCTQEVTPTDTPTYTPQGCYP